MELLELLQKRRSIRKYTGEHIPEDKLERYYRPVCWHRAAGRYSLLSLL